MEVLIASIEGTSYCSIGYAERRGAPIMATTFTQGKILENLGTGLVGSNDAGEVDTPSKREASFRNVDQRDGRRAYGKGYENKREEGR
jgi:hypothetical protein